MGCMLCPRRCGADRRKQRGFCGETERIRVARAALHMWEEPCISGKEGSGTIFFTGCNLRCVYCQNHTLSRSEVGKEITVMRLSEIMIELQEKGANNINLVTGTHYVPQIVEALDLAREKGLHLPIVYNCGGYESIESIRMLQGYVDIYLPDFKYWEEESGRKYSLASDYPKIAKASVDEMVRQVGAAEFTSSGLMKKGVIVRHLLLPGKVKEAQEIVNYLHGKYGDRIYLSLMNQYTPLSSLDKEMYPELNRRVTTYEYDKLVNYAIDTGVNCAFIQEGKTAKESFIPPFTLEGV